VPACLRHSCESRRGGRNRFAEELKEYNRRHGVKEGARQRTNVHESPVNGGKASVGLVTTEITPANEHHKPLKNGTQRTRRCGQWKRAKTAVAAWMLVSEILATRQASYAGGTAVRGGARQAMEGGG